MKVSQPFSCLIVGEGTLPIRCAEILIAREFRINGIVSSDSMIRRWAEQKGISFLDPAGDLVAFIKRAPCDYLFSIVNPHVLPKEVLVLPHCYAINYHDALLPRYAGSHATSWAIMNQEKMHGITWHVMTERVDAGDVLKQHPIAIDAGETALTLNAKCYEEALSAFTELVDDLLHGCASRMPQNLNERTFFPRHKRPVSACVISWCQSAEEIDALVRALDFGPYTNPLGLPKLVIEDDFIVVSRTEVQESMSGAVPGTVTAIDDESIKIATTTRDIALSKLLTIKGQPLSIAGAVEEFGLYEGYHLSDLKSDIAVRLTELDKEISRYGHFWVERLRMQQPVELPYTARSVSLKAPERYVNVIVPLPDEFTSQLAIQHPSWKLGDAVLTAFAVYVARICGMSRFDIGYSETELQHGLAGLDRVFASQVPLHLEIDNAGGFMKAIGSVQMQLEVTNRHRTYARDAIARYPALRSMPGLAGDHRLPVSVEWLAKSTKCEITPGSQITLVIEDDGTSCHWVYDAAAFDKFSITSMLSQFTNLLKAIAADFNQQLTDLPLLTETERHQLINEWNDTKRDYPKDKCIHELFEAQVEKAPNAIAVGFEDEQLTYREVNRRANQIANYLGKLGVGPEVLVGICLERSLEMLLGLLGILKAGGAYVPLDPSYPEKRLAFMLDDSCAHVLLTQAAFEELFPSFQGKLIAIDRNWGDIARENEDNPLSVARPDNLAYVIYTSGSTGTPKGVAVTHQAVNRLVCNTTYIDLSSFQVLANVSNMSFDAATFEIWGALLNGARIVVIPKEIALSPASFSDAITQHGITTLFLTTALFNQLAVQIPSALGRLEYLLFGGETADPKTIRHLLGVGAPKRLIHVYGPTETTTFATYYWVKELNAQATTVFIGRPIANTECYILDPNLNVVPIGVAGELHIGGDGLARGYLNRPELTAEKFIHNPFSQNPNERLYKTGDLARYLADGNIEFLGRIDNQVKIRGFRIEIGEIEAALRQIPSITDAVVIARIDSPGDKRLVAYLVTDSEFPVEQLRGHLASSLPEYMIPSAFVRMDTLPLTPNGKLDRDALPAPDSSRPEMTEAFVAPRNTNEELLTKIWSQVLKVEEVGIHDNFFDLGGHSLLAAQVMSRVRDNLRIEIPLRMLFEYPTVAGLVEQIDQILSLGQFIQPHPTVATDPQERVPLSFAQQRLWFLDQYEPNRSVYNVPTALRLKGKLDVQAIERSLNEIVRRHESLRTTFATVDGEPVQVIAPSLELSLPVQDVTDLPEEDRDGEAQRLATEQHTQLFDLTRGPLVRVLLIRLGRDDHVLVLTMHHIVSDGWSRGVLFRELSLLYEAYSQAKASPLSELTMQYADFAVWQRQLLQGEELEEHLSYWKKQLAGAPALLNLPTDRPRPGVQSYRGASRSVELSPELTEGLKAVSLQQGVTLFMTLLAAFQTLLFRYTGQEDCVVGSPIANRNREEIEDLIGFFVNTLVLRTDLSGDPTLKELLGRVRETALEAYGHQDLPFEKLVEELNPERNLSYSPVFQVMFVLQNTPGGAVTLSGLEVTPVSVGGETTKFDLTLSVEQAGGGLRSYLQYGTDIFDEATVERILGHWRVLLEGIVVNPSRRISELPLLSEAERHRLLVEWNDTEREYPKDKCIHHLFEEQVERTPEAIAVIFEDQQLSYRELNQRSNQLAHYLKKHGVGPDVLVGICMERSLEMIVALFGVLKAGGAYVPMDPGHPKERLAIVLNDAQLAMVVTENQFFDRIDHPTVICLDRDWPQIADMNRVNFDTRVMAQNLAYVIYTSGSTGKPKGVAVEHRALVNYSSEIVRQLKPAANDSFAMAQPFTVDACLSMLFPSLITGSELHVVSRDTVLSSAELGNYLQRWSVDFFKIAPSHLAALQAATFPPRLMPRRCLIIGGERSRWEWVRSVQALAPRCAIFNHYGPTETTVGVLMYPVHQIDSNNEHQLSTPLGHPIANTQAYILDTRLEAVPTGVTGELYIGGDSLARGYINQPQLTAERFIPNPFPEDPAGRLYKTGDLARYLPDGNIEFIGRNDDQIKIRGFRVEPGEIEAALLKHPQVGQAAVILDDSTENDSLIAYMVSAVDQRPNLSEIRSFLRTKLPNYMVPAQFLWLDALPRTAHGKLDRRALRFLDRSRNEPHTNYVAPRTPTEQLLAQIWSEVLKVDKVGIHDNFFDLGGHSLLATQLVSRVCERLKIDVALHKLFESPTIDGLSKQIELVREETASSRALPIAAETMDGEYPVSFAQEQFWLLEQLQPNDPAYHVTYGFRLSGSLDQDALAKAISELVRRHEGFRTTFHQKNEELVQVISEQWSSPLKIIDLSQHPFADRETGVRRIFQTERQRAFNLSRDLLMRASLLQLGLDKRVLILNTHHVTWDHWCIEILFRELAVLYRAYTAGKPSPLPEPPIQHRHFAVWQRRILDGAELEKHLSYWKEQLKDVLQGLNLPIDHPRKILHNRREGRHTLIIPEKLNTDLKALSRQSGVTPFMVFLAAFQVLLHRISGQDDIVVGTPVAGRDRAEVEGLIGVFLNTLALRTSLSGNPKFVELLARVREVALGAYEHQDLPFEKLVKELQPDRDPTQTPIFQVFINMYNFKEPSFQLDHVNVDRLYPDETAPQFDIEFYIREHDDGTHLTFSYDADLFEPATIKRMLAHYQTALEGIVADPKRRISELPLLSEAEKHQLLVEWNDTEREYPKDKCIHHLFEEQVERTPEAIAVIFEDQQLSYRELNQRSNQLAHYLKKHGVGPDVLVGICMERSIDMIVGVFGVLKAGAAYVPLDPSYPKTRLEYMLDDSQVSVVLTQESLTSSLPEHGGHQICLNSNWEGINREREENLFRERAVMGGGDLAYVIYTSGSTGKPKGVAVEHRSVIALLHWARGVFSSEDLAGVLASTSICFDLSVFELFVPLSWGGKVILAENALALPHVFAAHEVTLVNTVPSAIAELLRLDNLPRSVRTVNLAGEPLSGVLVDQLYGRGSIRRVYDLYGPSEDTTYSTFALREAQGRATIGRPISNTQVYLLDSYLKPVPIGVQGELYIGGDGLVRGYLHRPELTAEKFIPNPISGEPGARIYRTGDLARYLPDGNIEFLGRIDNQVKIRGFRIELGEIEAVLKQHPAVREAVVLAREESTGDKRLVAYVVGTAGRVSTQELRNYVQLKLPEYMVPAAFVSLDSLPLTPNGKVDRKGLPVPDISRPELDEAYEAPRTLTEELVAKVWSEVLKVKKVGIHDNFFNLGGHSLLATQVVSRIRDAFRIELPLRILFEKPTVSELAEVITLAENDNRGENPVEEVLAEIESLSDEEVERYLINKRQ